MNFEELSNMVIDGDFRGTEAWTRKALDEGVDPKEIIDNGLVPGMDEVGRRFKNNEYYMPEVLISARAMKSSMNLVRPLISETGAVTKGRAVIGTVQGDLHDIGKNLVGMMLEGAGFEVQDLGVDVAPDAFVSAIENGDSNLLCMSALLTTTMGSMRTTVEAVKAAELRNRVKIMVGGAPVSAGFAEQVGADGYAPDAATAVETATRLLND